MKHLILAASLVLSSTAIAAAFPALSVSGEQTQNRVIFVAGNEAVECVQARKDMMRINTAISEHDAAVKAAGAQNDPAAKKDRNGMTNERQQTEDALNHYKCKM